MPTTPSTPELLAACWTSAGDVRPIDGSSAISPLNIRDRVAAVAAAGYTGMGLNRADLVAARDTIGLPTLATLLADHGISTIQLEWITDWWTTGPARAASDAARHDLLSAAPILGVDNIKIGADETDEPVAYDTLFEAFDQLATDGANHGVRIAFENTPFSHHVKTTAQAIDFVTTVGNANGGLIIDIWHAYRGATPYSEIAQRLPVEYIFGVELDDGHQTPVGSHLEDTFDNRVPCGEGVFDVPAFITAVRDTGYSGPWGVEHMSTDHRRLPVDTALQIARDGALRCFQLADQTSQ